MESPIVGQGFYLDGLEQEKHTCSSNLNGNRIYLDCGGDERYTRERTKG
jgi:hypothetical protein